MRGVQRQGDWPQIRQLKLSRALLSKNKGSYSGSGGPLQKNGPEGMSAAYVSILHYTQTQLGEGQTEASLQLEI